MRYTLLSISIVSLKYFRQLKLGYQLNTCIIMQMRFRLI